jgi:dTDP-4-amino-4,6-dideoxy-D-galactose acyltransferase
MSRVASTPLVELLRWDTDFWGVTAARIRPRTADELNQSVAECRTLGVRWASMLVPVTDTHLIGSAIRGGFQMVDVRITMSTKVAGRSEPTQASLAEAGELEQAQALVDGAFRVSRFYVDGNLDEARCDDFYRTWVMNSFAGPLADAIVVSRHQGMLDAFVTVQRQPDGTASLPLVAVRNDRRGIGVGGRVVNDALNWLGARGATRVTVTTQLANVTALRVYESAGFATQESGVWLHRWFGTSESE